MKMKRFYAPDMSEAIRLIRQTMGDDAVILSNRKSDNGIEIIAATEYDIATPGETPPTEAVTSERHKYYRNRQQKDEIKDIVAATRKKFNPKAMADKYETAYHKIDKNPSLDIKKNTWAEDPALANVQGELNALRELLQDQMAGLAWSNTVKQNPTQALVFRNLHALDIHADICHQVATSIAEDETTDTAWQKALENLASFIDIDDGDILQQGGVIALLGPTGAGKTTTIAKIAAQYAIRHGAENIALVTTDCYRIAAHEQLKTYGKLLGVTVRVINDDGNLQSVLQSLRKKKLVLIDTAGMSQRDVRLQRQFKMLKTSNINVKSYLALSATNQRLVLEEAVDTFKAANLQGVIVTKVDESVSLGALLSVMIKNKLPAAFMTDGQRVPEDLHIANKYKLIDYAIEFAKRNQSEYQEQEIAMAFGGGASDGKI